MEIERDALLRVVKAARMSISMAEILDKLMLEKRGISIWDEIKGQLIDGLFCMSGETLTPEQSIRDSIVMKLLQGDMSDGAVTDWLIMADKIRKKLRPSAEESQPKPNVMPKEEFQRMYVQSGGYQFNSPEGG